MYFSVTCIKQLRRVASLRELCVLLSNLSHFWIIPEPLKFKSFHKPLNVWSHNEEPKQEWSYVDVREGAHMFYWLYYTTAPAGYQDMPLIMWLQVKQKKIQYGKS